MRTFVAALLVAVAGMVLAGEGSFDSNGVRIRFVDQGAGVPVVLVHGFTGSIERPWVHSGMLADLAQDHRVIALDLRGHGASGKPHDPAAYHELGEDIIRLLDHLGLRRAHLVGYSLGGIIAARLLVDRPERLLSVTLAGAAHRRSRSVQSDFAAEDAAIELERGIPYRTLILATGPPGELPPSEEAMRARSQALVANNDPRAHAALYRARRALLVTDGEMAAARVPVLAIIGSADPALARVQAMKARCPAMQLLVVRGAVHPAGDRRSLPWRPEFPAAVREFIRSNPG